jgi:hypothetical protein
MIQISGSYIDVTFLIWLLPLWLFIMLLVQLLYLVFLNYAPTRKEAAPPSGPIMPVQYVPASNVPVPQPVSAQANVGQAQAGTPMMPIMPGQPVPAGQSSFVPGQVVPTMMGQPMMVDSAPMPQRSANAVGKMIVLAGLDSMKELSLPSPSFFIGRFYSPEANVLVALDEKSISRRHAAFICDEPIREYYLKDLNSSFGTSVLINGAFEKLTPDKQERIYNEDVVQFGNLVTVRLLLPCETRASMTSL